MTRLTSRTSPLVPELAALLAWAHTALARARRSGRERGDAVQWVLVAAIGAALAVTAGTIIYTKIRDKANGISTTTP
jgi:hypothetical protein